jgi:hypothetical protein
MKFTITDGACLFLSTVTLALMLVKIHHPIKQHAMNIYGYLMFLLIFNAVLCKSFHTHAFNSGIVRGLFFITSIQGVTLANNTRLDCLMWTWPVFCIQMAAFMLSQRWFYDIKLLEFGDNYAARRLWRKRFSGAITLIIVCLCLMYLLYMFQLPSTDDDETLRSIFQYMAIISFVIAGVLVCVYLCGALQQLRFISPNAGNAAYFEAAVFLLALVGAGLFNLWLSNNDKAGIQVLIDDEAQGNDLPVAFRLVPYFLLTEYIPAIAFTY